MEILSLVAIAAVLAGMLFWHSHTKSAALGGVDFTVNALPSDVSRAVSELCCVGAKAAVKSTLTRITVVPAGADAFTVTTRLGDEGRIVIESGPGDTAVVRAVTTGLYIGSHPSGHFKKGIMALSAVIVHGIYKLLGVAPYAVKMKRFQRGLERRVGRQLAKVAR